MDNKIYDTAPAPRTVQSLHQAISKEVVEKLRRSFRSSVVS